MTADDVILVEHVSKYFGDSAAVDDVSFTIQKGEIFALLGPSGCGKTTTLRTIAGFEALDRGEIWIGGKLVSGGGSHIAPEKRNVGMVFQDYALFPHLSVEKNIEFGLREVDPSKRAEIVATMMDFVGLKGYGKRLPSQLSGGQQQRVALARALAPCPLVLLLDEPLSNLDADMRNKMRDDILSMLRKARTTAIIVTHDQEEAFSMADRVAVLNMGRIEQIGTPEEIYHYPRTRFVAEFVGEADFLEGTFKDGGVQTEIGFFRSSSSVERGANVQVMIRPDDISFEADEKGDALVVQRQFKGEENLYHIKLPSGFILHSSRSSTFLMDIGSNVKVKANPDHVIIFSGGRAL